MAAPAGKIEGRRTAAQRATIERLVRTGTHTDHTGTRAYILLRATTGPLSLRAHRPRPWVSTTTPPCARARLAAEGSEATPHKKKAQGRQHHKLNGTHDGQLNAPACSMLPEGRNRWGVRQLADALVEPEVVASVDPFTVWRTL